MVLRHGSLEHGASTTCSGIFDGSYLTGPTSTRHDWATDFRAANKTLFKVVSGALLEKLRMLGLLRSDSGLEFIMYPKWFRNQGRLLVGM